MAFSFPYSPLFSLNGIACTRIMLKKNIATTSILKSNLPLLTMTECGGGGDLKKVRKKIEKIQ